MQYEKVNIVGAMRRGKFPQRHAETQFNPEHCTEEFDEVNCSVLHGNGITAMIGPRGTGKTQIATWAAESFVECVNAKRGFRTDTPVFYTTALELFTTLRADQHNPQTVNRFVQYPLLIIDEIQERGETDFEDRMLTQIIDRRYGGMRPTLIIGNLKPDQLAASLGRSIVDRIRETGKVIVVDGVSRRSVKPSPALQSTGGFSNG